MIFTVVPFCNIENNVAGSRSSSRNLGFIFAGFGGRVFVRQPSSKTGCRRECAMCVMILACHLQQYRRFEVSKLTITQNTPT